MPFFNSLLYYQTNPATFEKICISKLQPFIIFHFIRTFSPTFYTVIKPTLPIFICFKVTAIHSCDGNSFPKTTHLPLFFFTLLTALLALFSNTHHCPFLFSQESLCSYTPTIYFSFPQSIVVLCVSRGSFCWLPPVFIGINK